MSTAMMVYLQFNFSAPLYNRMCGRLDAIFLRCGLFSVRLMLMRQRERRESSNQIGAESEKGSEKGSEKIEGGSTAGVSHSTVSQSVALYEQEKEQRQPEAVVIYADDCGAANKPLQVSSPRTI